MPRGRKWTGLCLAVANGDGDDEIRIIERCSVSVREGISKFAAFVNRTRRFRSAMRTYPSGERELSEEFEHASFVAALVWINLRVVAFEIAVSQRCGRAMTRARDIEDI